jgi:haloalkane dehalogenase
MTLFRNHCLWNSPSRKSKHQSGPDSKQGQAPLLSSLADTAYYPLMRKLLIGFAVLILGAVALGFYNNYSVQKRGNGPLYNPDIPVLRTADTRFEALTDFPFAPNYLEIEDPELGALRVHYLDEGPADGEIILLLHGQATWSYSYRKMIPLFTAAGFRVIVPDLIGFGRSDKPADWEAHTFQKQVDWLDATLKALEIKNANGFLFDWGGYFGLRLAAEQPELFSRLILVTTTMPRANSLFGAVWVAGWRRYIYEPEEFPISGMVSDMTGTELDAITITGLDAPYPDESYKGGPRRMPMMIPATPLHPAAAPNNAAWDKLAGWDKPTLTLLAESISERGFNPQEFYDQMPGTAGQPHQIYPGMGFFIIEDVPVELAEATLEFINAN